MNLMKPLTADPDDYCFFDTETRALPGLSDPRWGDVTKSGARRYASSCKVTILTYGIGATGPVKAWVLPDFADTLRWLDAPHDLLKFLARALKGEAWLVAQNSFFDRNVCNRGMVAARRGDTLPIRCVLDLMAQGFASNLPGKLDLAAKALGFEGKDDKGKALIELFAPADGGTPQTHPAKWQQFIDYAIQDTEELRRVFLATRPLFVWEWEQFWASEYINDIGLPIDRPFATQAARMADAYAAEVDVKIKGLTRYRAGGKSALGHGCYSVNQHKALADYVYDALGHLPEATDILVKKYEENDEGDGMIASSLSLERTRVEKLIAYLERLDADQGLTDEEYDILQLLEVRLFGASATPKKFAKMLPMLDAKDRLGGQYTFNGAQQTGRFSSRGVQVHNLTRAHLGDLEEEAIEFILDLENENA